MDLAVVATRRRELEGDAPGASSRLRKIEAHEDDVRSVGRLAPPGRGHSHLGHRWARHGSSIEPAGSFASSPLDAVISAHRQLRAMIPRYHAPRRSPSSGRRRGATPSGSRSSSPLAPRWKRRASSRAAPPPGSAPDEDRPRSRARIEEIEGTVKHDVIAFLTHVEELAGAEARWLHRGMTSSDVLDTSLALLLCQASDLLVERTDTLIAALKNRAVEHRATPMIGRSHGMHAVPITFGLALAGHLAETKRGRERLVAARAEIAVGKIAGAVGTYAHLSPSIEERALASLDSPRSRSRPRSSPAIATRLFFCALAVVAAGIERLTATSTRPALAAHRARRGRRSASPEARRARARCLTSETRSSARTSAGSRGSSGPRPSLRSRTAWRSWHERDISHSSVERIHRARRDGRARVHAFEARRRPEVEGLVVYPEALARNLERSGELYFSEAVLLALVEKGLARQRACRLVQRSAMQVIAGAGRFRALLGADVEITPGTSRTPKLDRCFDLEHALHHVGAIVERATGD